MCYYCGLNIPWPRVFHSHLHKKEMAKFKFTDSSIWKILLGGWQTRDLILHIWLLWAAWTIIFMFRGYIHLNEKCSSSLEFHQHNGWYISVFTVKLQIYLVLLAKKLLQKAKQHNSIDQLRNIPSLSHQASVLAF